MSNMHDTVGLRSAWKSLKESHYEFEPANGTLWGYMRQRGNPCFNLGLLKEIRSVGNELTANSGHIEYEGAMHKVNTYVAASHNPGVFSLGGDLALFLLLIRSRDREALSHYARLCIDNIHAQIQHYQCPTLTTVSLVQGEALGGGFEMALCSDVLIAEELILSGKVLPAARLHEMGIVDVLARNGQGEAAAQDWIAKNARRRSGHQAVMRVRQHVNPVTREELDAITDVWVDCALRLEDRDLRMMGRVVRAQMERMEAASAPARTPTEPVGVAMAAG